MDVEKIERVRLLTTLKSGKDIFRKGAIIDAPIPPVLLGEIRKGTGTVEALGIASPSQDSSDLAGMDTLARERAIFEEEKKAFEQERETFVNVSEGKAFFDLDGKDNGQVTGQVCPHCGKVFKNLGSHIHHAHKDIKESNDD